MSDATRAVALTEAVKLAVAFEQGDRSEILDIAKRFDDFLNAVGEGEPQKTSTPGKEPPKTTAGSNARKTTPKTEDEAVNQSVEDDKNAEDLKGGGETEVYPANKEGVQAIIAKLLQANKRKEAIALLKKFNAASATGVKDKEAAKFIAEAKKILGTESGGEEDLTA